MKQRPPKPTPCHNCGFVGAVTICPLCREERPSFAALKKLGRQVIQAFPPCRYHAGLACDCCGRGLCLEVA